MKAIVFGGSGFLGSHVADALTEAGYDVIIYDLKPSPFLRNNQKMVVGDITDVGLVNASVKGCHVVYNFAGISDIDEASKKPLESVQCNILGNAIIMDACRLFGVKRFVFASTLYVYSKTGSFYRATKQACELLIESYNEVYNLPYTILRYGSLYGPRADERCFIHKVIKQAVTQKKIVREGDGNEIREYIHVYDAARGSVESLADEFKNQYVIITGNQQMRVRDVLSMVKEILDNRIGIEYLPARESFHYEITPYNFSPKLAKRIVHKSYIDLGQGILTCIQNMYDDMYKTILHETVVVTDKRPRKSSAVGRTR
jgi:UDP-glucose 4-epimerase